MIQKVGLRTLLLLAALLLSVGTALASSANFRAHLSGDNEVPAVITKGQGQTILQLNKAGDSVNYKLIAANITGVTQAHIHCGPEGANGPVVVFLYGLNPGGTGRVNGVLSEGTFTNADIIPRPDSAVCPGGVATLDDLIAKLNSGGAYVNVHTLANPPGEIRGHLH